MVTNSKWSWKTEMRAGVLMRQERWTDLSEDDVIVTLRTRAVSCYRDGASRLLRLGEAMRWNKVGWRQTRWRVRESWWWKRERERKGQNGRGQEIINERCESEIQAGWTLAVTTWAVQTVWCCSETITFSNHQAFRSQQKQQAFTMRFIPGSILYLLSALLASVSLCNL